MHAHIWVPVEDRRGHWDPMELEFQVVVNCLLWMLRTELSPSGRPASTHNY